MSNKRDRLDEDGLRPNELMQIVSEVVALKTSTREKRKFCKSTYPDFVDRYPMLFEKVCEDDFDMTRFNYMMGLKQQILDKKETVDSASVQVGQKLFDIYVKPIVDAQKENK